MARMLTNMCSEKHKSILRALVDVRAHAAETYPRECCGFVYDDGSRRCTNVQDALHAEDPDAFPRTARRAFRMSAPEQLELARSFDSARPVRVLYHSHVDAGAYFSESDVAGASLDGEPVYPELLHLVVSVREGIAGEAALYALDGGAPRELARFRAPPFAQRVSRPARQPGR